MLYVRNVFHLLIHGYLVPFIFTNETIVHVVIKFLNKFYKIGVIWFHLYYYYYNNKERGMWA